MMKTARVITQNMKHIRHAPVTVEQYLRDQLAKSRKEIPFNFWGNNQTNYHNEYYGPYMQQSNNGGHSVDSSNDEALSVGPQQYDVGVDSPTVHRVENQTGTKNVNMPQSEPDGRPKQSGPGQGG